MTNRKLLTLAFAALIPLIHHQDLRAAELKIISDRTDSHVKPLLAEFERKTGSKVTAVFLDDGILTRLETRPTEADVVITKNAELLEIAKSKKWIVPFQSEAISKSISPQFLDPDKTFFVDAYRSRAIFYSALRVKTEQLSTYEDLASPKWKGKLCIRSGFHEYNLALFSQFILVYGNEKAKAIMKGLHENLARSPGGNDREQAKGIFEGRCDVALMNTYYHPIMATTPDQKAWAEATKVFFPDQQLKGSIAMRSGIALTGGKNQKLATRFLEYIASPEGQTLMADLTFQFPTNSKAQVGPQVQSFGADQSLKWNEIKWNFLPLAKMVDLRPAVNKILTEINFDNK